MTTTAIDRGLGAELAADLAATAFTLAKRFAAGATMWSIAPSWEPHALHIAVEFVHPVIMGKRALPAVALTGPNLVDLVRVSVRPGDIVIGVGAAADPDLRSVMRRSPAWGATTIWIGSGERPTAGAADHVLWLDDPDPRVPATGGFVLFYHLLWELTHVCFEHSGLLKPECAEEVCVTCSDEGRIGEVVSPSADGMAAVRTARGVENVVTALIDPVAAGELVLVHAGTAISRIEEDVDDGPTNPPTSCIRSSMHRRTTRNRCLPISPRQRRQRPPRAWRCGAPRWKPTPTCWIRLLPRWHAASRPADGCSPSETAAAAPIPPPWPPCSPARRPESRYPLGR